MVRAASAGRPSPGEGALNDAVHDFFAVRIFGPDRRRLLAETLRAGVRDEGADQEQQQRTAALHKLVIDLRARQDRLLDELASPAGEELDEDTRRAFRQRIHERFADLGKQLKARQGELDQLTARPAQKGRQDAGLLDRLPTLGRSLSRAPEKLQRELYDALRLEVIYSHRRATRRTSRSPSPNKPPTPSPLRPDPRQQASRICCVPQAGFEPATPALGERCSIP